ncbi:protein of unknown function (DUF1049) [Rubidibacter lacunae KORDI 51-2]|uniref:Lipopolysaccharide assembly protein A domain-containing protein n=1 Tax=Rubidibacter lacunae KORDI 51-2 TaxID=582515 RepID=U5D7D7_9CHRO|nr:LapA family protein [Rubidibacter lacunae]ERN40543.1 protein of unknown function (DUF1049) [Rubidibacter lacunae KORDI 51-2]
MRQLNFLIIFTVCLALVLFGLENTELVRIQIVPGYEVQAPLAIEMIVALGVGALVAWVFGAWSRLLRQLEGARDQRELRSKDEQIQSLTQDIEGYKAELDKQRQLLLPPEEQRPPSASDAST